MRRYLWTSVGLCMMLSDVQAANYIYTENHGSSTIKVGTRGFTRIAIENDRITKIVCDLNNDAIEMDKDTGQLFIRIPGSSNKPVFMTLITEASATYDLVLLPESKRGKSVILRAKDLNTRSSGLFKLLRDVESGHVEQYKKLPLVEKRSTKVGRADPICQYMASEYRVLKFRTSINHPPTDFYRKGDHFIYVNDEIDKSAKKRDLYVIREIEGRAS